MDPVFFKKDASNIASFLFYSKGFKTTFTQPSIFSLNIF